MCTETERIEERIQMAVMSILRGNYCRCIYDGIYCDYGMRLVVTIARLGSKVHATLNEENEFVDAWRAWNFHMHDVNEIRQQFGLLELELGNKEKKVA